MDSFNQIILSIVRTIPSGTVVSYGQVAAYAGTPKAAREVGWALQSMGNTSDFPWWRVLNSAGVISLAENPNVTPEEQQQLLEKEEIVFTAPLALDIERYRYRPDVDTIIRFGLARETAQELMKKYAITQLPLL